MSQDDEWMTMIDDGERRIRRAFDVPGSIPLRRHPADQARRTARQMGGSVAEAEAAYTEIRRVEAEVRAEIDRRRYLEQHRMHLRDLADNLGEAWGIRPEVREWDQDTMAWLLGEFTRGDAELAWLRGRTQKREFVQPFFAAVWASVCAIGRTINGWAWPFQVLVAFTGLFVLAFLAGWI